MLNIINAFFTGFVAWVLYNGLRQETEKNLHLEIVMYMYMALTGANFVSIFID